MFWEQLQQCKTEEDVNHLVARWIAKAFREAEKKKRAWNRKAQARINKIREPDLFEGLRRRDEGAAIAEGATRVQEWKLNAEAWINAKPIGFCFTSDDLTFDIGLPDEGQGNNNVVEATFLSWSRFKRIVPTGRYLKSARTTCHAAVQREWRLVH